MELLGIAGTALGIAGILGGAAAYFQSSRSKTVIELQDREIDVRKESYQELETKYNALKDSYTRTENRVRVLEDTVTQAPEINKLIEMMGHQHSEVITKISDLTEKVGQLAEVLAESFNVDYDDSNTTPQTNRQRGGHRGTSVRQRKS